MRAGRAPPAGAAAWVRSGPAGAAIGKEETAMAKHAGNVSRRRFLKGAAASAGAGLLLPAVVPSSVFGAEAPSNRITMGCIGVGGRGTWNLRNFIGRSEVRLLAVCDVDRSHAVRAKQAVDGRYGGADCGLYHDFRDLLARDDIDAITVCTPDHWHALVTIAAAKAGKDIYCEKPLVNTVAEGRAVCDAVNRYGRVLQTGSHERSTYSIRFACELVRNGRVGKLHTIWVNLPVSAHQTQIPPQPVMPVPAGFDYDRWLGPAPWAAYTRRRCHGSFRYILDYSGGEMTDRGAHVIDIAQLGNGTDDTGPVRFSGTGWAPTDGLFDTFMKYHFECTYAGGVKLIGRSVEPRGIKFEGTDGWVFVHIHGGRLESEPASILKERVGSGEFHIGYSVGHHQDFLNAIRSRQRTIAPPEVGNRTAAICHLVNIALLTGRELTWDPDNERIVGDSGAAAMLARPGREPWTL